LVKICSIFLKL